MQNEAKFLTGHADAPSVIYVTDDWAYVMDVSKGELLGRVPASSETGCRVCFGPVQDTCVVGAWDQDVKCYNYHTGQLIWSSAIKDVSSIRSYGDEEHVNVSMDGSILLNGKTGKLSIHHKWTQSYFDRHCSRTLFADRSEQRITVLSRDGSSFETAMMDFALLDVAFDDEGVAWSEPGGRLVYCSLEKKKVVFSTDRAFWFNVPSLVYERESDLFFGVASDWNLKAGYGLFQFDAKTREIKPVIQFRKPIRYAFACRNSLLVLSDGRVLDTKSGESVSVLDFNKLF